MSGWNGYSSGSGPEREPSEERGQAAWGAGETGAAPPWASAETQAGGTFPPPWAPPPTTPGYAPPPDPAPAPRNRLGRVLLAATVTLVLGAGSGTGVWWLTRDTGTGTGATPGTNVTVTTSAPRTSAPASQSPSPALSSAAGYRRYQDPVGYTLDVPEGWTRRQKQGRLAPVVYYDAPADDRRLQIFELVEDTPARSLALAENDPGYGFAHQPGYQALDRDEGATWSELTYRYDDEDKGPRRVIDHRFRAPGGTLYAIRSSGPESLAPALIREPIAAAVRSFCPSDGSC